jgi:hypothetical protein
VPWTLIGAGLGLLAAATLGTYLYVASSGSGTAADEESAEGGVPVALSSTSPSPSPGAPRDEVLSIENLPAVADQRAAAGNREPLGTRPSDGARSRSTSWWRRGPRRPQEWHCKDRRSLGPCGTRDTQGKGFGHRRGRRACGTGDRCGQRQDLPRPRDSALAPGSRCRDLFTVRVGERGQYLAELHGYGTRYVYPVALPQRAGATLRG